MCLKLSINPFRSYRKIAKKDIVCYKVLKRFGDNSLYAYFQDFSYTPGISYSCLLGRYWWRVEEGFHSFVNIDDARDWRCHTNYNSAWREPPVVVVRCVIPKGSEYYTGYWGESKKYKNYASNQIIIKEML